jgi:uncharacterized protein YecE (DUF72 family)
MLYAGTSGYSFKEWVGSFYPAKTPAKKYLAYYASKLGSVEINHTFRRFPTAALMASWAEETPESFKLSIKMHQSVTHRARLKNVGGSVRDFLAALDPLGPRLGVVLFQLPPFFKADLARLESFLGELPAQGKFALEFRHPSWNEPAVAERLRNAGVALCAAEVEIGEDLPPPTAAHAYLRLRKEPPYTEEEFRLAAGQIRELLAQAPDLYLYVKHDEAGLAPQAVLRLSSESRGEG